MLNKICSRCNKYLSIKDFYKKCSTKDGFTAACKFCILKDNEISYLKNKKNTLEKRRKKDKDNRKQLNAKDRKRYRENINYKLRKILRSRLKNALKRDGERSLSAVRDLGCSIEEFKAHIESKWYKGMSWATHGKGPETWQIDHIIELNSVDLTDPIQLAKVIHFTNLQPLWFDDHINKS